MPYLIIKSLAKKSVFMIDLRKHKRIFIKLFSRTRKISNFSIGILSLSILALFIYKFSNPSNSKEDENSTSDNLLEEISTVQQYSRNIYSSTTRKPICIFTENENIFSDFVTNESARQDEQIDKNLPPSEYLFRDSSLSIDSVAGRITSQYTHVPLNLRNLRYPSGFRKSELRLELPDTPDPFAIIPSPILLNPPEQLTTPRIKILILEGMVGRYAYLPFEQHLSEQECPVTLCEFSDRPELMLNRADVVVWYTVPNEKLHLPKFSRPSHQIWVFQQYSPPPWLSTNWKEFRNQINWTISYRSDSTLPDPFYYYFPVYQIPPDYFQVSSFHYICIRMSKEKHALLMFFY